MIEKIISDFVIHLVSLIVDARWRFSRFCDISMLFSPVYVIIVCYVGFGGLNDCVRLIFFIYF